MQLELRGSSKDLDVAQPNEYLVPSGVRLVHQLQPAYSLSFIGPPKTAVEPPRRASGFGLGPISTDKLLVEVLRLPRREGTRVVEQLLSSLDEPDDQVATAWAIELERRWREVADGRVRTTDWDKARAEILKELDERRARQSTP